MGRIDCILLGVGIVWQDFFCQCGIHTGFMWGSRVVTSIDFPPTCGIRGLLGTFAADHKQLTSIANFNVSNIAMQLLDYLVI